MGGVEHLGPLAKPLLVLLVGQVTESDRVLHEPEQESEIETLVVGQIVDVDGACLGDDCAEEARSGDESTAALVADGDELGAVECLRSTRDFDGPPGRSRREVDPRAEALGCQDIDRDIVAPVPMRDAVRICSFEFEPEAIEFQHEAAHGTSHHAGVDEGIEIAAGSRWALSVLEAVQQHHLGADQGPSTRPEPREVTERVPQP